MHVVEDRPTHETIAEADTARANLHDSVVEGRALRCELTRQDKEGTGPRPY